MRGYSLEKMKHVGLVLILSVLIGLSVGALDAGFGRVLDYISIFSININIYYYLFWDLQVCYLFISN